MSNTDLRDNIVRLLEEVVERANYINRRHPGKQDLSLDIDLVKDDLRSLYRHFELLKNANGAKSGNKEEVSKQPVAPPPVSDVSYTGATSPEKAEETSLPKTEEPPTKPEKPSSRAGEPLTKPEEPAPKPEEPVTKPEEPAAKTEKPVTKPEEAVSRPVKRAEKNPEGKQSDPRPGNPRPGSNEAVIDLLSEYAGRTIGDQYMGEDKSVHQRISNQKEDKSIGTRMQQNPITSLKEAIGVNEKFLFINELFKGNIQAYNEAIARLNEMDDAKAAFDYLNELSMVHSWDANRSASTIEKLADLVHRRHMSK